MNRKKIVAIMLVMMIVSTVCLFADEKSNTVDSVYITWSKTGYQSPTVNKGQTSYGVKVYYTIYYEDGSNRSGTIVMDRANRSSPISFDGTRTIKTILVTKVEK
jgi:uncharacterized protein YxeA